MPGGDGQEVKEEKTLNQKAQDTLQEYLDKKKLRDVGYKKIYGTNPTLFQVFPEKERKEVQLWKKDVTAPIIEKTLDRQMKELEKKNDQAVNIKETGAKKENQRENQQEFNLMV